MNGISTITQKGQVVIPKQIRDFFAIKPFDKIFFEIKDDQIIAEPIYSVDAMFGAIKTKKKITKRELKKLVREAVVSKHRKRT